MKKIALAALIAVCSSLGACRAITTCDASATAAIRLSIRDAQTKGAVDGQVTIIWTEPSGIVDTTIVSGTDAAISVAIGYLAGEYRLTIRAPGYADWKAIPVIAAAGCKPETRFIPAELSR
jgi:hypothetical protein